MYAVSRKIIEINPEELTKILKVKFNQPAHKLLIHMLYDTGGRVSEVLNLRWENVNLDKKAVWGRVGKRRKEVYDWFYFSDHTAPLLQTLMPTDRQGNIFSYTRQNVNYVVRYAARKAGIPWLRGPHQFRHAFAIRFLKHADNISYAITALQRILHHQDVKNTFIYLKYIGDRFVEEQYQKSMA